MANINTAFVQQIFHTSKRKWKPDVHHHRQADHLRAGFEVAKWAAFCHLPKLKGCPARLNQFYSDSAKPVDIHLLELEQDLPRIQNILSVQKPLFEFC